ncbi:unnamed protein product [Adineta steineri]|uniref:NmrA-like domain-containing protein n=1 Tax=Adineta steineri TaxID=433720 RepID=A0A815PPT5_9BILA|nr:unnamed protein product [Adineta steineri]CAF1451885.1 unnamed protein product [Adineta steineri]CAF4012220.1 unnamed protein product [Adineta steineri]CAF4055205.1 unnamed protein product [Adineta steineri]
MAQEYASKQPQGFKNHVEKVAIVGGGGQVGKFIVEELLKIGKHKITALTREDSTSKMPPGVEIKKVNYDDPSSLVEALKGQEVLIITMAVTAPKEQQTKLIEAAAAANVPWVLPNEFGGNPTEVEMQKDSFIGEGKTKYRDHIEKLAWPLIAQRMALTLKIALLLYMMMATLALTPALGLKLVGQSPIFLA